MDSGLIIGLIILIMFSGYFSATETAYSSLSKIKIKNLMQKKNKKAALVYRQVSNFDKVLSTILVGNNIVNITSATLATLLFTKLVGKDLGPTISTIVMTVIVLIFGEIFPKSLAKEYPENFAMSSCYSLQFFIYLFVPLTIVFTGLKKLFQKIFKNKNNNRNITEEELITIVEESENGGVLDMHESELIRSAIEFNDMDVSDILVPRVDMVAININKDFEEIGQIFIESGFSRLPIYEGTRDNIVGFIHEKDYYILKNDEKCDIKPIIQRLVYTTPTAKISTLLRQLQKSKTHLAIVIDEYGGTKGMLTLEDILEELVGEIWDEHDESIDNIVKKDNENFVVLGITPLEDLFEYFEIDEDADNFTSISVSGWIGELLDRLPVENDELQFRNLQIKVMKVESRRVEIVNVKLLKIEKDDKDKDDE